ncbi:MAG TPA: 2-hydroxymuconate tautomerase [Kofleriaceae bacterium]|nr:2-hydroxymuconate tautomerase [Kofleriaceae bacterium]
MRRMPVIEISLIEGRSKEQKRALMASVTDAVERSIGAPRETIRVILREVPAEHWAVGGVPKG